MANNVIDITWGNSNPEKVKIRNVDKVGQKGTIYLLILLENSPDEELYNSVTLELAEGNPSVPDVVFLVMVNHVSHGRKRLPSVFLRHTTWLEWARLRVAGRNWHITWCRSRLSKLYENCSCNSGNISRGWTWGHFWHSSSDDLLLPTGLTLRKQYPTL